MAWHQLGTIPLPKPMQTTERRSTFQWQRSYPIIFENIQGNNQNVVCKISAILARANELRRPKQANTFFHIYEIIKFLVSNLPLVHLTCLTKLSWINSQQIGPQSLDTMWQTCICEYTTERPMTAALYEQRNQTLLWCQRLLPSTGHDRNQPGWRPSL